MGKISSKLRNIVGGYGHWCPGCNEMHVIITHYDPDFSGPAWSFNGDINSPTFTPSIYINTSREIDGKSVPHCCHYFMQDGILRYCGDSTHDFAGKNVPLPDLP